MKKTLLTISFLTSTLMFYHCSSTKSVLNTPANAELAIAQKRWSDATVQSLTDGYTIYTTKCNKCHGLKTISKYSEPEWDHEIKKMAPKSKLTEIETETLKRYIFASREVLAGK